MDHVICDLVVPKKGPAPANDLVNPLGLVQIVYRLVFLHTAMAGNSNQYEFAFGTYFISIFYAIPNQFRMSTCSTDRFKC